MQFYKDIETQTRLRQLLSEFSPMTSFYSLLSFFTNFSVFIERLPRLLTLGILIRPKLNL